MKRKEAEYLNKLSEFGCIACYLDGNPKVKPEIHHPRYGQGLSQQAPHLKAIPLCPKHHRGTNHPHTASIHLSPNHFISQYGNEEELWTLTQTLLAKLEAQQDQESNF